MTRAVASAPPRETLEACVRAGVCAVQIREKELDDDQLLAWCREARRITRGPDDGAASGGSRVSGAAGDGSRVSGAAGVALIINDRPDIAAACDADGVHLGTEDRDPAAVRREYGDRLLIGASCHSLEDARRALASGADYIGVGPMFETRTKDAGKPRGPGLLGEIQREVGLPAYPIGGVTLDRMQALMAGGARGVAVCSAVIGAADVEAAVRAFRAHLEGGGESRGGPAARDAGGAP